MRRAISEPFDSSAGDEVVDITGRQADICQLSVIQVMQTLGLAPPSERMPISLKHTQDAPCRCDGWSGRLLFRGSVSRRCDGGIGTHLSRRIAWCVSHQGNGALEVEPCGIAPGLGCEARLLGWHRMLLLLCRQGA